MNLTDYLAPDRVHGRLIDRLAYARDASIYRLVPRSVVRPRDEQDVLRLLEYARASGIPITFRTGGTSLSGQSVTTGIVAETVRDWKHQAVLEDGHAIELEPGVIGEHANRRLEPWQRKIGPDPASLKAAMIGGIVSNNSSGMCCGVVNNSYHTLKSIRFILASGHLYDTSQPADYDRFSVLDQTLARRLSELRQQVAGNPAMVEKIRHKYRIKNTLGYSLNAFLDYTHPLDILAHLLVGAEGTLGFISRVVLRTVPDPPVKSTGLLLFDSLPEACGLIPALAEMQAEALELMDAASLSTARYLPAPPYDPRSLKPGSAGLLCEFQRHIPEEVRECVESVGELVRKRQGYIPGGFSGEASQRDRLWQVRKGLYPTVGSLRRTGSSVITEDICFDVERLVPVVNDLHRLFETYGYREAVIFGHAKDGNLHFVVPIDLESRSGVRNYEGLMDELVELTVAKYDGSLKAEHGTGRNMAPFVSTEWGPELFAVMQALKKAVDPANILNPEVLLTTNDRLHVQSLKPLPPVAESVDLCVECGFCEAVCASKELTLTPRQRIAVARELVRLQAAGDPAARTVCRDFEYAGNATCAVDGLCGMACPVNINTGVYIKLLREERHGRLANLAADWTAANFRLTQYLLRVALWKVGWIPKLLGERLLGAMLEGARKLTGNRSPAWNSHLPGPAPDVISGEYGSGREYLYFTTCINRVFGSGSETGSLVHPLTEIARLTGVKLIIPEGIQEFCCGMPYASKGFRETARRMQRSSVHALYEWTRGGQIPVVVDTSPCTHQFLVEREAGIPAREWQALTFLDIVTFLDEVLAKTPSRPPLPRRVILHPTCSTLKLGQLAVLERVTRRCAETVILPDEHGCCGFAGDRGLLVPELTASATRREAAAVHGLESGITGYSSSRTCEIGMESATGREYRSLAYLVRDYLSQPES